MSAERDEPTLTHYTTEAPVVCFDFSRFPEVLSGGTLSNPQMTAVANVTFAGTEVLTEDFYDGGTSGPATVASGKGVKVKVTCTTAGKYTLACTADIACEVNGEVVTIPRAKRCILIVK